MKLNRLIADKAFYKSTLAIAIPIMIQNGITNFVNMLDNIMVGQIGTAQMSGVAIVNQIMFVFIISIFGACSGAGIFTAQYHGNNDPDGVRDTTRFKIIIGSIIEILAIIIFKIYDDELISLFLQKGDLAEDTALALQSAKTYLSVMVIGIIPTTFIQIYSSTLRETGETVVPMKAGTIAVVTNLILNYILIFDHFGYKGLGVAGAAIATVVSRYIEVAIIIYWTHKHKGENPFAIGLYKTFRLPLSFMIKISKKGFPLMMNEILWSLGSTTLVQCYSVRGLTAVAAINIANTIANVFNIVFIAMGSAVAIIIGQLLGSGKTKEAKDTDTKLIFFSTFLCAVIGLVVIILAPLFPKMYNTEPIVKETATYLIMSIGVLMPVHSYLHTTYFTLRSGGKTFITFLFDSGFMWLVTLPVAFYLSRQTNFHIIPLYIICQSTDLLKSIIGYVLLKKDIWINNIVSGN